MCDYKQKEISSENSYKVTKVVKMNNKCLEMISFTFLN